MRRFVEGTDRGQSTLFPECLEDWIGEDNPVPLCRGTRWFSGLIANDPDHNQFVDVSYFAQTPGGQRRKLIITDTPSQKSLISDNLYEGVL